MKSKSHKQAIVNRLKYSFRAAVEAYDDACHNVIRTERQWEEGFGTTYRRNGETVEGSNRNIYDLGNLDRSQQVEMTGDFSARFSWDGLGETPAVIVHEGATLQNGTRIPARRWTQVAADEADLGKVIEDNF